MVAWIGVPSSVDGVIDPAEQRQHVSRYGRFRESLFQALADSVAQARRQNDVIAASWFSAERVLIGHVASNHRTEKMLRLRL